MSQQWICGLSPLLWVYRVTLSEMRLVLYVRCGKPAKVNKVYVAILHILHVLRQPMRLERARASKLLSYRADMKHFGRRRETHPAAQQGDGCEARGAVWA